MEKEAINKRFVEAIYSIIASNPELTKTSLADKLGIKPAKFSEILNGRMRAGSDLMAIICEVYFVSPQWLLTGRGEMFNDDVPPIAPEYETLPKFKPSQEKFKPSLILKQNSKLLPLVLETVAAGFGNDNFSISEADVKEFYVVPRFKYANVDFMIEVSGDSMTPHLNSGDVIACTILRDSKFIQWNRCHVIATREQGLLVKRLAPSEDDSCLQAVSDNPKYRPFNIPKEEITGLALVVGSICLE